jgi:hypothetical protein
MIASRRGFLADMQSSQNGVKAVRYQPCPCLCLEPTLVRA